MGVFIIKPKKKMVKIKGELVEMELYAPGQIDKFNPKVLGLGDIGRSSETVEAVAAMFDLAGFTNFCRQSDPHLSLPGFLNRFLNWLFFNIREDTVYKSYRKGKSLWTELPFFAKFLGDGVLFLWDAKNMDNYDMCNILIQLRNMCARYSRVLLPELKKSFTDVPEELRCGVARGKVYSIGDGADYVGPCINLASRLQKMSGLRFCFSKRGIDLNGMSQKTAAKYEVRSVFIRGVGDELICMEKWNFKQLKVKEQALYKEV